MAHFFRIVDNNLFSIGEVNKIGFNIQDPFYIPDEYLTQQKFTVMRTCHGIGDWCILSAMPRLIKEKYPNCKVYIPSSNMLKKVFKGMIENWGYSTYDCANITNDIFKNNPYVDGFVDSIDGEIYHDHYRIYDTVNTKVPLVEQMLKFWQFQEKEIYDSAPEIYFSEEEITNGNNRISTHWGDSEYGYISVSSTFGSTSEAQEILQIIDPAINWYYYGEIPIKDTLFNHLKNVIEVKPLQLNIRQQAYLKTRASINVGNETGMNLWTARYSSTYILYNRKYGSNHGGVNEGKIRKDPFSSGNFIKNVTYI